MSGVAEKDRVKSVVKRILRLDEDLAAFYGLVDSTGQVEWARRAGSGRLLRSPTVWEDLVKTMCTTNCSWSLTEIMVRNLVEKLGDPDAAGNKAFPPAPAMAACSEAFFREEIRSGYRSPYFIELAESVASGKFDPEELLDRELTTAEVRHRLRSIKGFGDYAADNMLKLLSRYDGLALDSWLRSRFYDRHNKGKKCPDKKIERHYRKFGDWRGLAIWCDMTEDWFDKTDE